MSSSALDPHGPMHLDRVGEKRCGLLRRRLALLILRHEPKFTLVKLGSHDALSGNERHILIADEQLRMVRAFNPPIVGSETHDENGVYPLVE